MKGRDEKVFWLRPAFQRHSFGLRLWRALKKGVSSTSPLLFFFVFLFISLIGLACWIDLAKYTGYSSQSQKLSGVFTKKTRKSNTVEVPLDCAAWNRTATCPRNYPYKHDPQPGNGPSSTCPEYFRWIHEDLKPWKGRGITEEMVEKGQKTAHFKLTILDGKMYVTKYRASIQTRALFTMWGIAQLARWYPAKLPDLELLFDSDDRPVVPAKNFRKPGSDPPPLFRYCSDSRSLDIVFPDWSFWGWAEVNIMPWRSVLKEIKEGNKKIKWEDREPYAYWKGNPHVCPWRGDLLKCNATPQVDWNTRLYVQDWIAESKEGFKQSKLGDQCTHRYKIYIEGWAWSVSDKYILACDSPTLLITLRFHDFFTRGMVPQQHYWPVKDSDKCRSLKFAVEWGNNHTDKAKAIGEAGSRFIHEDMKMEYVYDYMFHLLNEYGKLMMYQPSISSDAEELCPESMACSMSGIWRKCMDESLEKSPSNSHPCTMPPPYEPQELKAFVDGNVKATQEVEALENEYWNNQVKKQL